MPNRIVSKKGAVLLSVAVFVAVFAAEAFLVSPRGNPDPKVCLAVEAVAALAAAMLFHAVAAPRQKLGDRIGLGALSVSVVVAASTFAVAALGFACACLLHPVFAGGLAAIAFVAIILRNPICALVRRICWGAPLAGRAPCSTVWAAELAEIASGARNETARERISELQALCASIPRKGRPSGARELDNQITEAIHELKGLSMAGDLARETVLCDLVRDLLLERLEPGRKAAAKDPDQAWKTSL